MNKMSLTMHPASEGDALILRWHHDGRDRHILIDLGRQRDYRALLPRLREIGQFALFVMSHIDADHIAGAMPLVASHDAPFKPADVWFNGYQHLREAQQRTRYFEELSVLQAEKFSKGIAKFRWPWNAAFGGERVSTDQPRAAQPIGIEGLQITLLGPCDQDLIRLEKPWGDVLRAGGMLTEQLDPPDPGRRMRFEQLSHLDVEALAAERFDADPEEANGSSISFLAEHKGHCVLLSGDAHAATLERRLQALGYGPHNRLRLDLFKLPHHGSHKNLTNTLLGMLDCTRFAISTNGNIHNHPDRKTVARILVADRAREKTLYFNSRPQNAKVWDSQGLQQEWNYRVIQPPEGEEGLIIDV